jgi:hypothetical protein
MNLHSTKVAADRWHGNAYDFVIGPCLCNCAGWMARGTSTASAYPNQTTVTGEPTVTLHDRSHCSPVA